MCCDIFCCDSVIAVKYGWKDSWLWMRWRLNLELFFYFYKITTEVSNWTEGDAATSDACKYRSFECIFGGALLDIIIGVWVPKCIRRRTITVCVGVTHIFLCFIINLPSISPLLYVCPTLFLWTAIIFSSVRVYTCVR